MVCIPLREASHRVRTWGAPHGSITALGMELHQSHFWHPGEKLSQHQQLLELFLRNQSVVFCLGTLKVPIIYTASPLGVSNRKAHSQWDLLVYSAVEHNAEPHSPQHDTRKQKVQLRSCYLAQKRDSRHLLPAQHLATEQPFTWCLFSLDVYYTRELKVWKVSHSLLQFHLGDVSFYLFSSLSGDQVRPDVSWSHSLDSAVANSWWLRSTVTIKQKQHEVCEGYLKEKKKKQL